MFRDDALVSSFPLATLAGRVSVFIRDEQEQRKTNWSADAWRQRHFAFAALPPVVFPQRRTNN